MFLYVIGIAILVVLIVIAFLLGRQQGNQNQQNSRPVKQQPARQQRQPVRQQTNHPVPVRQQRQVMQPARSSQHRKIEYAAGAALHFIESLHAEGVDRGCIASLGNNFRVDQPFTTHKHELADTLIRLGQSRPSENTALYDSIALAIKQFQDHGRRNVPWVLIVLTDGKDNASQAFPPKDKQSPAIIGHLTARCFTVEPTNYFVLVGIGDQNSLDVEALTTIGHFANSPAIPLANFHLL